MSTDIRHHVILFAGGDRVPFQAVIHLGCCLNSGGGRLGARAGRGHPFGCLDADFPQENGAAEWFMRMGYHREAEPTAPLFLPSSTVGPCVDFLHPS